ncbi:IS66 family transposase [[Clostridium] scindens]|uniref:IS66 family transposase n=1 Tax=Clostridium scindens (strain JCM 10418 / VPI 12708) TaxID=29347 RepID=UPI001D0633DD|nr:transposase [[Clostridium] scindens]MCB6288544.1 transposase [[Clostridium] scindens]MCB6423176.1 transposase [[Clostridium] scindens]MCB7194867.1 transposase [[Clostridium] scindens]MCB7288064.1 transposase [[Clostridium] scindens]MCG4931198.1 transposase [[Clostridium] scindens]
MKDRDLAKQSVAYQVLIRISAIYKLDESLKGLTPEERLRERQEQLHKGETAKGLKYSINQEKQLKVFLIDGEVPIDNSDSERSIRTFLSEKRTEY